MREEGGQVKHASGGNLGFKLRELTLLAIALCVMGTSARAQEDPDLLRRLERLSERTDESLRLTIPEGQQVSERIFLDFGGSVRFGAYAIDDRFSKTRVLRQTDAITYVQAEIDGGHRFFGQLRFVYDDFNAGDSFDGQGDDLREPIGDRYWYSFDLRQDNLRETGKRIDHNFALKVGRQFVHWGSGLVLSRVMYAFLLDLELNGLALTALYAQTPRSGTVDFDGSRPSFDTNTRRLYYGGSLEYRGFANHRPAVSYLVQRDRNDRDFQVISTPGNDFPTGFDYDSSYLTAGSQGSLASRLTYRVELVREMGRGLSGSVGSDGSPVGQTREDIQAWAGVATLSYPMGDVHNTRFDLEVASGSGDDDRLDSSDTFGGNRSGTTDRSFNSLGYVNTGLALSPDLANLFSLQLGASTSPTFWGTRSDGLRVGFAGFLFTKLDEKSAINVPTIDHTFVGGEVDFSIDWRITSDFSTTFRYGLFLPGDAMPSQQDDYRHFGYLGVTYAF